SSPTTPCCCAKACAACWRTRGSRCSPPSATVISCSPLWRATCTGWASWTCAFRTLSSSRGCGTARSPQTSIRGYGSSTAHCIYSPRSVYMPKHRIQVIDDYLEAVHRDADGGTVIDPAVVRSLLRAPEQQHAVSRLTPRELEVLEAMAEGLSNRGIAERLFLSLSTVEKAISAIFDKFDLTGDEQTSRRVQAVLRYLDER